MVMYLSTADDFGLSVGINEAIIDSVNRELIRNVSVLVNGPKLDEGLQYLAPCIPSIDMGIHFNLTEGRFLTRTYQEMLRTARTFSVLDLMWKIWKREVHLEAIEAELLAQLSVLTALGYKPTFINSHQHIHMYPPILSLVIRLAHEYQIPYIRYTNERRVGLSLCPLLRLGLKGLSVYDKPLFVKTDTIANQYVIQLSWDQDFKGLPGRERTAKVYEIILHPASSSEQVDGFMETIDRVGEFNFIKYRLTGVLGERVELLRFSDLKTKRQRSGCYGYKS